ncbi:alpha/beta fold hydrolase [Actinomadura rubrisoli]|uniref:Alpha/beta fold hydrolase n=1 Tax=Actinomadura rubrisoli TaxID=2530368 RepID=A0A4R5B9P9_9ACTN|nr:alpha/beta fold hydrolase [Actinomadura rubrisoli]TDD81893.1 alpha/beta fold hydrolase [Actinomadura rubrisoli]
MRQMWKRAVVLTAAFAAAAAGGATAAAGGVTAAAAQRAGPPAGCVAVPGAECGTIRVPLVRAQPELGSTTVAYAMIRHRDGSKRAKGTVTINPGGPGDSAFAYAPMYADKFGALLRDHDLLLIEPRGVGRADPLDCGLTGLPATRDGFVRAVGDCGRALGARGRGYTSAEIADDIDAVRAKLGIDRLDVIGESYGTYLMTVYAQRHPGRVRSVVLSSAYPLAFDMWARPNVRAARRAIELLCARSGGACDGGRVLGDIARLSERLRERPIPYTMEGGERRSLDDTALASIVYAAAGQAPEGIGDVPAMVRTALTGDTTSLVEAARQVAPMSGSSLPRGPGSAPPDEQQFNAAHAAAVMCNDYPTLWNRKAPVPARLRQFEKKRAALPERTYWPFGKRAWTSAINDQGNACIRWPDRTGPAQPTGGPFPDVPVLVVSGDLDPNTPTESGRLAAGQFRRATVVEVSNVGHVAEREPSACVIGVLSGFVRDQKVGDLSCLATIPPVPVHS